MNLGELTIDAVKPLIGLEFTLVLPDGSTTTLKLEEALKFETSQRRRKTPPKREAFSIYFAGDPSITLPQGMYLLRNEAATFDGVFLVPVGRDETATEYEAVFA